MKKFFVIELGKTPNTDARNDTKRFGIMANLQSPRYPRFKLLVRGCDRQYAAQLADAANDARRARHSKLVPSVINNAGAIFHSLPVSTERGESRREGPVYESTSSPRPSPPLAEEREKNLHALKRAK